MAAPLPGLTQALGSMKSSLDNQALLSSLQRALLGQIPSKLRQASAEVGTGQTVCIRFEYDGEPSDDDREFCSVAATEVIADFPAPWELDEQHLANPVPGALNGLSVVAFRRNDKEHAA